MAAVGVVAVVLGVVLLAVYRRKAARD